MPANNSQICLPPRPRLRVSLLCSNRPRPRGTRNLLVSQDAVRARRSYCRKLAKCHSYLKWMDTNFPSLLALATEGALINTKTAKYGPPAATTGAAAWAVLQEIEGLRPVSVPAPAQQPTATSLASRPAVRPAANVTPAAKTLTSATPVARTATAGRNTTTTTAAPTNKTAKPGAVPRERV